MMDGFAFFFFKQKTAYEMHISDWSSDVCSSDLAEADRAGRMAGQRIGQQLQHGKRGDRLARTAFADQRQRLAAGEVEADMADGIDGLYPVTEAHADRKSVV